MTAIPATAPEAAGDSELDPAFVPPHPGSQAMPRWDAGCLNQAPHFSWRNWTMLLGPGLVAGASAIGGGEWLTGPMVSARYGGALLWLATFSILGQVLYNIEISRYTLYTGEPIFTGKFRTLPGPGLWLWIYLLLDFGSLLPYLASSAAVPLAAVWLGELPNPEGNPAHEILIKGMACGIFVLVLLPLIFGGKVYNSLKVLMTAKLVAVFGLLTFLAIFYSTPDTWVEIVTGFFKIGTVPVQAVTAAGLPDISRVDNVFLALWEGRALAPIDLSMIGILAAMAAISGNGGLTNASISNFTRDQGWGMGHQVGAIPSIVGGHAIQLSHVGAVFQLTRDSLKRWHGWCRHVAREQLAVWMPACFLGIALPSMLSIQFLPRGTDLKDRWQAAGMTANGVQEAVGGTFGPLFWYLTLGCGFLVLATSMASTADGVLRRWVDVFWTASPRLRKWDSRHIGYLYFGVLCVYATFGLLMLQLVDGTRLLVFSTNIYNYALGFSCWHTLVINTTLLPRPLRPGWFARIGLVLSGTYFTAIAVVTTYAELHKA